MWLNDRITLIGARSIAFGSSALSFSFSKLQSRSRIVVVYRSDARTERSAEAQLYSLKVDAPACIDDQNYFHRIKVP